MGLDLRSAPVMPSLKTRFRRSLHARTLRFATATEPTRKQLLVDVSVIISGDARTGIQRVVRALLGQLTAQAGNDLAVQPVFLTRNHGYCRAKFQPDGTVTVLGQEHGLLHPASARAGDVFLGLDLAAHLAPSLEHDLEHWRRLGVSINFLVYDLLPIMQPDWFPPKTPLNVGRWVEMLSRQADRCICISGAVASDLELAFEARGCSRLPLIDTIPLGWDLTESYPSIGLPANIETIRSWLTAHTAVLAVGTIEPRKGYDQLLGAMTEHWQRSPDSNTALLIIGRPGWKTDLLQQHLRSHCEIGKRLIWLDEASDELLAEIYGRVAGLIAASHAEGFGLPLVEALANGTPVLARDIPVFREICGANCEYFEDDSPVPLCARIEAWLARAKTQPVVSRPRLPRWADSGAALMRTLGLTSP